MKYYKRWIDYNNYKMQIMRDLETLELRLRVQKATLVCKTCQDRLSNQMNSNLI
jgi:hypothetical protein